MSAFSFRARTGFALFLLALAVLPPRSARSAEWQFAAYPGCAVRDVLFHPAHAETCCAGSATCGSGAQGFHGSGTGGLSWLDWGAAGLSIKSLALDPKDTRRIYMTTASGVYRSEDGGETWTLTMNGIAFTPGAEFMMTVAVNPATPETLFVGKRSSYTSGDVIYRSFDRGDSWHELYLPSAPKPHRPYDLAIDPKNPAKMFAARESYLSRSNSSGDAGSWYTVLEDPSAFFRAVTIDPVNTDRVYVASGGDAAHAGIYRSHDGGDHWKRLGPDEGLMTSDPRVLAIDPVHPANLYVGTADGVTPVYGSRNGGNSWEPLSEGLPAGCEVNALAVDPETGSVVLAATNQGIWRLDTLTSVAGEGSLGPTLKLEPGSPNPSHGGTVIRYALPAEGPVRLTVFNAQGRRVRTLVDARTPAGTHEVVWDGRDEDGRPAASGVYFCRLQSGPSSATRKTVLLE